MSSLLSRHSQKSKRTPEDLTESTPLLLHDDRSNYGDTNSRPESPVALSSRSLQSDGWGKGKSSRRWPTIVALAILTLVLLAILGFGFAAPEIMEEYAKEAVFFEPTNLSIDSFTSSGVQARVQGDFTIDASRVHKKAVRDLGRAGTWIAKAVESKKTTVEVHLPEYDDVLLGSANLPPIVVDIRNGHTTHLDFITELKSGDVDGIRRVGTDWLDGRLGQLRVQGTADVCLKSGIFRIGPQQISKSIVFKGDDIPVIPEYNITNLKFDEGHRDAEEVMLANVSLVLSNDYPVSFEIPSLRFDILVPGCLTSDPYIAFADAVNSKAQVRPKKNVNINVSGFVRKLPETLITACPDTERSPIDRLLHSYIQGDETTIYVRGSKEPSAETPNWITALIEDIVVPLPFPGHTFSDLIRNFSLTDVHFGLPDPFAAPTSPKSSPRLSAVVEALIGLPEEIQFPINVGRVRADSDIFYHQKKLGSLDLSEWQRANSTRAELKGDDRDYLLVRSTVKDAPLDVTDDRVLADIVQALVFGGKPVGLGVKANVDVETTTVLGQFVVRDLPAEGKFFVKR
ncbi:MAG: hypothetical protein Q9167_003988 [Letrouitia subvulpina]